MKDSICTVIGLIGGTIAALFGGWDTALQTLVIFMAIDYITGLVVAGVFHASPKTKTGALESKAGWKGLIRKGETLLIVLVACQLDAVIGGSFVRDAAIIGFSANEAISIVENAGLMGLPIPATITKAIDILKQRAETPEKGKNGYEKEDLRRYSDPYRSAGPRPDKSAAQCSGQAFAAHRQCPARTDDLHRLHRRCSTGRMVEEQQLHPGRTGRR